MTILVPFNKLVPSKANVRRVKTDLAPRSVPVPHQACRTMPDPAVRFAAEIVESRERLLNRRGAKADRLAVEPAVSLDRMAVAHHPAREVQPIGEALDDVAAVAAGGTSAPKCAGTSARLARPV